MTSFVQIFLIFLVVYRLNIANGKPFGEVIFKKNFDVAIKALPFKPITFIKEKWSPFGKFGFKHGIVRRDLDKIKPLENVAIVPMEKSLTRLPAEVYEVQQPGEVVPPMGALPGPPFIPMGPIPAPPPPPVVITPPPPKIKEIPPIDGLQTNIYRDELIQTYLKSFERPIFSEEKVLPPIENNIMPEKPKNEIFPAEKEENPIMRGSRLALYFGNILLDVLAKFIGGAKAEQTTS